MNKIVLAKTRQIPESCYIVYMIKEREMKNMTMQEAFDKAIVNPENFNDDGSVNWNFIDADVYMDTNTYGMTQEEYIEQFDKLANEWEASQ